MLEDVLKENNDKIAQMADAYLQDTCTYNDTIIKCRCVKNDMIAFPRNTSINVGDEIVWNDKRYIVIVAVDSIQRFVKVKEVI
jgi:hypothetical protein